MRYKDIDYGLIEKIKSSPWYDYNNFFSRGMPNNNKDVSIIKVDKNRDRKPVDVQLATHDKINKRTIKEFGIPLRNGLFFYNYETAVADGHVYGAQYVILPTENSVIYTNPEVRDMYVELCDGKGNMSDDIIDEYVGGIVAVKDNNQFADDESEFIGFGEFYCISYQYALENNLFRITDITDKSEYDIDNDESLIAYVQTHHAVISDDIIIRLANVNLRSYGNIGDWIRVIMDKRLHTNDIIKKRITQESTRTQIELLRGLINANNKYHLIKDYVEDDKHVFDRVIKAMTTIEVMRLIIAPLFESYSKMHGVFKDWYIELLRKTISSPDRQIVLFSSDEFNKMKISSSSNHLKLFKLIGIEPTYSALKVYVANYKNALADLIEFGIDITPELKELHQEKFGKK